MPEIQQYLNWEAQFLNTHPDLIGLFAGDNPLANADNETQRMVQLYRSEKARLFPNIEYLLNEYYSREGQARKQYGSANPIIYEYFDWSDEIKQAMPQIKPYLTSKTKAVEALLGKDYVEQYSTPPMNIYDFPQEVLTQLETYFIQGKALGPGAKDYLYLQWEKQGKPSGTYDKWLKTLGVFYGK